MTAERHRHRLVLAAGILTLLFAGTITVSSLRMERQGEPHATKARLTAQTTDIPPLPSSTDVTLTLRPHCTASGKTLCTTFEVLDPTTLETPPLRVGDTLDLDLVAQNLSHLSLARVRAWLEYDPQILEGTSVTLGADFPVATPGEKDFDAAKGYTMISGETAIAEGVARDLLVVARATFVVKSLPMGAKSVIAFHDPDGTPPHTAVYTAGSPPANVLQKPLGSLAVLTESAAPATGTGASASSRTSVASAASSSEDVIPENGIGEVLPEDGTHSAAESSSAEASSEGTRTTFRLLQPQNLRVTTEGTSLYAAWDALPSPDLQGYHVYYGTQTGRYIQRRTIRPDQTAIAVRSLTEGQTYYVSVRGFNAANEETAFSKEAGVTIGNPRTSTAPLGSMPAGIGNGNPLSGRTGEMPGNSGMATTVSLLVLVSALIGTAFAFRRQTLVPAPARHG